MWFVKSKIKNIQADENLFFKDTYDVDLTKLEPVIYSGMYHSIGKLLGKIGEINLWYDNIVGYLDNKKCVLAIYRCNFGGKQMIILMRHGADDENSWAVERQKQVSFFKNIRQIFVSSIFKHILP